MKNSNIMYMSFSAFQQLTVGTVVRVNNGLWVHRGIVHSFDFSTGTVWIIDNDRARGHVGYQTLEQFSSGKPVFAERFPQNWFEANQIIARAESQLNRGYSLFAFNCEHFVTFALGMVPESRQLQGYAGFAGFCLVAAIIIGGAAD